MAAARIGRLARNPETFCRFVPAPSGPAVSIAVVGWLPAGENRIRRTHWSARWRTAETLHLLIATSWRGPLPSLRPPVAIAYKRWSYGPPADWDNVAASSKDVLDAIRHLGVIPDDSPAVITRCPQYLQGHVRSPDRQGFEIAIAECGAHVHPADLLAWQGHFE